MDWVVEESILTGESEPVKENRTRHTENSIVDIKRTWSSLVHLFKVGQLSVMVTTGDETEIGKINQLSKSFGERKILDTISFCRSPRRKCCQLCRGKWCW